MARTDLLYDVKAGDIMLVPSYPDDSEIIDLSYDGDYLVGLPDSIFSSGKTVYARIPFIESGLPIKVKDNSIPIFPVGRAMAIRPPIIIDAVDYTAIMEGSDVELLRCNLPYISLDIFSIRFDSTKNKVVIGDGKKYDMKIGEAKDQNSVLLTLCDKGNNYRYPNTGVGINKFLNNHLSGSVLANEIINQFSNDSVTVINASFDKDTGKLDIETKEL